MNIAIDTHFLSKISQGTGTYTYQLLNSLKELITDKDNFYLLNKEDISVLFDNTYKWKALKSNSTPINIVYGFMENMKDIDIIHTNYLCPLFNPYKTKRVITVHDILFKTHNLYFPKKLRWGVDFFTNLCLSKADKIICVSKYTRDQLIYYYPFVQNKCEVIYEAPSNDYKILSTQNNIKKEWGITKPYILFVGRFAPIKNIEKLITIYTTDQSISKKYDLVLVGNFDKSFPNQKLYQVFWEKNNIKILSSISNLDLNLLYNNATMLYFVSHGEGFGLPILEAMAAGCPVLTSTTTACSEIAGNAAYKANPLSIEDIHTQIRKMLFNEEILKELRIKGIERVNHFSWNECASKTYQLYQSII